MKVAYPLHPLYGQELPLVREEVRGGERHVCVQLAEGCHLIPHWMTDAAFCSRLTFGLQPRCAWQALLQLHALVETLDTVG